MADGLKPVGRFAPTPSGRMHLGNVFSAMLAWLSVRSRDGEMVLRMEDLDTQRTSAEFAQVLREDLLWLGLTWDRETPAQSTRSRVYDVYFQKLDNLGLLYPCYCTRSQLHSADAPHLSDGTYVYPGTCRHLTREQRESFHREPAWRVMVPDREWVISDRVQGESRWNLATDCGDMVVRRVENGVEACFPSTPEGWTASGEVISPWRAMMVANDLNELVNCDLVTNLCEAPAPGLDFSWVRPGRVLWQWWSVGSPRMEDQAGWYDAAARLGWEYYLIDDGWRMWRQPGKDQWQCLKEVIDYGKSKGVESIVWVNSEEMRTRDSIRAYLEKVKETGAVGIKIDFIPEATPAIVRWYQDALEETYALRLLCNFHGCIKPSGLRRTWPHELTREAVRGHEFHISRYDRVMPKDQDAIKPFTRLLAGPADFTPTAFVPEELLGYTWPHELAQAIVYLSPLTHFADNYIYYLNSPVEDLLRDLPVVWDETRVLPGSRIGKVAAFARRSGDEYWVGVVNGAETSSIELPFDDLKGPMMATVIADREGVDDAVVRTLRVVSPGDRWKITLRPGGGYVVRLQPIHGAVEP